MPTPGGTADKIGNRYEALWAIDQLLRIVGGAAYQLTLEPLDRDESRGIEFAVSDADGSAHYWSVKRQTTRAAGWTLAILAGTDDRGRSILADLVSHVERDASHRADFASSLGAPEIEELRAHAASTETLQARLHLSNELRSDFENHFLPVFGGDAERARRFLLAMRAHAVDEHELRDRVHFAIRSLLYVANGSPVDVDAVRGYLADLLLDDIHRPITRDIILERLSSHGIRIRDWAIEKSVRDRIESICETYVEPLRSEQINGKFLPLVGSDSILTVGTKGSQKVLAVGRAGGGKSTTIGHLVDRLRESRIPVLPVRFDQLPEGILSTAELGRKLLLPESPALVLAGVAGGRQSVLVLDQLDAISMVSGRRPELWSLFDALCRESERYPMMSLVVGCRDFDLEHDHRLRGLKAASSGFILMALGELSTDQVDAALREAGTEPASVQPALKPLLRDPFHLSLFLKLPTTIRSSIHNRDGLFDSFWNDSERRVDQRLGRKAAWTQTIDKLVNWLSDNQELSAPQHVLDDFATDARAMASEHFLVLAENRYRFLHESLFDYVFARRFATHASRLVDFLLESEQHLFRRAQVRQVLSFLRTQDLPRYLKEFEAVLSEPRIRFHIKKSILQWLSALPDPREHEWAILEQLLQSTPDFREHVLGMLAGRPAWFDVIDRAGFFESTLACGDSTREQEAVWILALPSIMEERSTRISELLRKHRRPNDTWNQYLRFVCRTGNVFHSREMFDLFLSLIDDGTLDEARPGFAQNDDWWSLLYSMADKRPDLACEAIGHWFDRVLSRWLVKQGDGSTSDDKGEQWRQLKALFQSQGAHQHVIGKAAKCSARFAEQMLPRVARFIADTAKECPSRSAMDPLWSFRPFGSSHFQVHDDLLEKLAQALEDVARRSPATLDGLLQPFEGLPCDAIAFLILRAWAAAPDVYADRIVEYFVKDPRCLKIGYQAASSGSFQNHVSTEAVKVASSRCSAERLQAIEKAILMLTDDWEARNPRIRGIRQLELLGSIDCARISAAALRRLEELHRKFTDFRREPPAEVRAGFVGSPISESAQGKMSDEQWLRAMGKYAGVDFRFDRAPSLAGGEHALALALQAQVARDPARFIGLAERMSDDLPASYFGAILWGVAGIVGSDAAATRSKISEELVVRIIRRSHALPGRPSGRQILFLIEKCIGFNWPDEIIDAVVWYATNDSDPTGDVWKKPRSGDKPYYGGDPFSAGINSTRGGAAGAITRLLFDKPDRFAALEGAVHSLVVDRAIAVRSCAIGILIAMLNIDTPKAIAWFKECVAADPALLATHYVERFIYYAGYRDFASLRSVIDEMLESGNSDTVEAASRQVCLLGLDVEQAAADVERVEKGTVEMRRAAAHMYATNISHKGVGAVCRKRVVQFFTDDDESVRAQAAIAFEFIAALDTPAQAELINAFLDADPGRAALAHAVRPLEHSPVKLPDLVRKLVTKCVEAYRTEAGDISKEGAAVGMDLAKIILRLYAQTEDQVIKSQCLSLIDEMERRHFLGVSEELQRLDR
jgi:hypothetical protein